jgi:hypothetical protein
MQLSARAHVVLLRGTELTCIMKRLCAVAFCLASLLPPSAMAAETSAARSLCSRIESENPLPPALAAKILIVQKTAPSPALFTDTSAPTPTEVEALANFDHALGPCRDATLAALGSSPLAEQRRALLNRNEKVLFDLMAEQITFGEANRRWEAAQRDFEKFAEAQRPVQMADWTSAMSPEYVGSVRRIMAEQGMRLMPSGVQ